MITTRDLDNWFTYHPPKPGDLARFEAIRAAARHLATAITAHTPVGADQSAAVRLVREAVMTANAAIACERRKGCPIAAHADDCDCGGTMGDR